MYIYILIDPRDGLVRYVGCTSHVGSRYNYHLSGMGIKADSPRNKWILELKEEGELPQIEVVEETGPFECYDRERFWITHFLLDMDMPLFNRNKLKRENFYDISYYEFYRKGGSEAIS